MSDFVIVDDPGHGVGFRITELYAFLAVFAGDADEGVVAWNGLPLVAANKVRLEQLRAQAEEIARLAGRPVRLVRFSVREDLETIAP